MSTISFKTKLFKIKSWTILRLPERESEKLPSRGLTLVRGTINNFPFQAVLEPDGKGSHWFRVDKSLLQSGKTNAGDTVVVTFESSKDWLEPAVPEDLENALLDVQQANALWMDITPMARWDWIRWIRSTKNLETRKRRIETACDKLAKGERRPCCFNRNLCTEPYVCHNGVLLEPPDATEKR